MLHLLREKEFRIFVFALLCFKDSVRSLTHPTGLFPSANLMLKVWVCFKNTTPYWKRMQKQRQLSHWQSPDRHWLGKFDQPCKGCEIEDGGVLENLWMSCIFFSACNNLAVLWDFPPFGRKGVEATIKISLSSSVSLRPINTKLTHAMHYALLPRTKGHSGIT